jgi:hypothetical protein
MTVENSTDLNYSALPDGTILTDEQSADFAHGNLSNSRVH